MDQGEIRIGVIGCGGFGLYALQQFVQVPGVRLAGMAGTSREASIAAARRFGVPDIEDGLIDLPWSRPRLDAKADGPIRYPIGDFFLTNAICRNSPTMHRCSEELVQGLHYEEAAE